MSRKVESKPAVLSPDVIVRVLGFLPLADVVSTARSSRRFKLLATHEALFEAKLYRMQFLYTSAAASTATVPSATGQISIIDAPRLPFQEHAMAVWRAAFPDLGVQPPDLISPPTSPKLKSSAKETFRTIYQRLKPYYTEFRSDKQRSVLALPSKQETAIHLAMLNLLGRTFPLADSQQINEELYIGTELFESKTLSWFDQAYQQNDINELKAAAEALYYLNGGAACAHLFIYKCPIFFDHHGDVTDNFKVLSVDGGQDSPLQAYLDEIFDTVEKQMPEIEKIFLNPKPIMYLFVQKVFDDLIIDYLTRLLKEARSRDLSLFLQSLTQIFEHTSFLVQRLSNRLDNHVVEKMFRKCLKPFTDSYMEQELSHIKREYNTVLEKWNKKLSEVRKTPVTQQSTTKMKQLSLLNDEIRRKMMTSMKTVLMTPGNMMQKALKTNSQKAYKMTEGGWGLDNMSNMGKRDVIATIIPEKLDNLDMLLSVEIALAMIHTNKEGLKRCVVMMSSCGNVKPYVEKIFGSLIKSLGLHHVKPSFDLATERLSMFHPTIDTSLEVTPLTQFFEMAQVADLILQMVHLYFTEEIQRYLDMGDFLGEAIQEKKKFEALIDDCIATGLDQAIRALIDQVEYIIATEQSPTDYCPDDDEVLDIKPTRACTKAIECMNKHAKMFSSVAEKQVIEVFLSETGVRFFALLCKHIRRMTISEQGGWQLINDLNVYHTWSQTLRNAEVVRHFKALKEIANIYIVSDHAGLKELIKDQHRYAGIFRVEEVYEFIERRKDYEKIKSTVKENECIVM